MKVGLSYSRCLRDIFEKKVSLDEVLVIVSRTDFDPTIDQHWNNIWIGYTSRNSFSYPEWINHTNYEKEFKEITLELWDQGKLHQPRKFGVRPPAMRGTWYDLMLSDSELELNPAAKKAFKNYQLIAGLVKV
jgi:hypothetical protein